MAWNDGFRQWGFYCPVCGGAEHQGERCGCGWLWNTTRLELPQYAVRLGLREAVRLQDAVAVKLTQRVAAAERARRGEPDPE